MGIVEFEVFRDFLGIGPTDPEVDDAQKLYEAIGARIRRITRREFEGDEGGSYTETIRLHGAREFSLAHIPVEAITSIARHNFDGTDDDPYAVDRWRLEDAQRGRIRLNPSPEYVTVVYTTTGEIPAELPWAYLEWGKARWAERARDPSLTSYHTGEDAETYSERLAGQPPKDVVIALLALQHSTGGGVV